MTASAQAAPARQLLEPDAVLFPPPPVALTWPEELRLLARSRLFWVGLALKLACGTLLGSHFATRWFAPFVAEWVHHPLRDPWATFFARGEPLAFPYGPGMLAALAIPWLPTALFHVDPGSPLGLLLLRLPLLAADLTICLLLQRWLRVHVRDVVLAYWLSPLVLYATYVHGQLDLIPTALLCLTLHLLFERRIVAGALVAGAALATKAHLLIAIPFALVFLYRRRGGRFLTFGAVAAGSAALAYALPARSGAFRQMVFGSAETQKIWSVAVSYGSSGLVLYVAVAALMVGFLRFASYLKINRELLLMYVGAIYIGLMALVPPQPGWFIWSMPFVAYLAAKFTRSGRFAISLLTLAYLAYFFFENPALFLEASDPILGQGSGAYAAAALQGAFPALFSLHAASVAWTLLFSATALTVVEMYRKGVRSNSIYTFRDESFTLGIGGDSGSGKHLLAADLRELVGPELTLVQGDDDHKWERGHVMWRRFSHLDPRGNELRSQLENLAALRRGGHVEKRVYDHTAGRFGDPIVFRPSAFIAIVGLHPFYLPAQRKLLDLRIYLAPDEPLRRAWKIARDVSERGYDSDKVVAEMARREADSARYVRSQRQHADLVIACRQGTGPLDSPDLAVDLELVSELEGLLLFDVLDGVPSLKTSWSCDESLARDRLSIEGQLSEAQLRSVAAVLIPNLDELVVSGAPRFGCGSRGLSRLVVLHAISARLRSLQGGARG